MAFNLGGAAGGAGGGAAAGALLAAPTGGLSILAGALIGGAGGGLLGGFGGSSKKKVKIPWQVLQSMTELLNLGKEAKVAQAPLRGIESLSDLEKFSIELSKRFAESNIPESLSTSISETLRTATTPVDVTQVPELKALIEQTSRQGGLETNRALRRLNIQGATGSTGGRKVIEERGRLNMQNILATLAPFGSQLRGIRQNAVRFLSDLASQTDNRKLTQIGTASAAGGLVRSIGQSIRDALFQQQIGTQNLRFGVAPSIFGQVLGGGGQFTQITGGEPSMFSQFAPLLAMLAPSLLKGGTGTGGGVGTTSSLSQGGSQVNFSNTGTTLARAP